MKTMVTVADVKKLWSVKVGYYFAEKNRPHAWMEFKRYCNTQRWDLKQAYDYLTTFKWYKH